MYIAGGASNVVLKVTPAGALSTIAGTGRQGSPTPGPATQSDLNDAAGVAVDAAGDVYIDDLGNDVIEKVTPTGTLSIVAGTGRQGEPTPGPATASDLGRPASIAASPTGDLYIADQLNSDVEEITPVGTLSVIAGIGHSGTPKPGPAAHTALGWPAGVAVSSSGDLYIADLEPSAVVEKVTPSGALSIIAGVIHHHGDATPGPAKQSRLGGPVAVAIDPAGDVYIADLPNHCVEEVTPAGVLSVIAGRGAISLPGADQAQLNTLVYPQGLAMSPTGDLLIASTQAQVVEAVADVSQAHSYGRPRLSVGRPSIHGSEITQTLSCVSGAAHCTVTATLRTARGGTREMILAKKALTIPVGSYKTWTLAPNPAAKRLLEKLGSLRTMLAITGVRRTLVTKPVDGILFPETFRATLVLRPHRS